MTARRWLVAPGLTVALALPVGTAADGSRAPEPAPELRFALVARGSAGAFVVIRLTADLPRDREGAVRASLRASGREAGRVRALDRLSFRHYCFRIALRRPWPKVGQRVGLTLRAPNLPRPIRTTRLVDEQAPKDSIGARLGCRLPTGEA